MMINKMKDTRKNNDDDKQECECKRFPLFPLSTWFREVIRYHVIHTWCNYIELKQCVLHALLLLPVSTGPKSCTALLGEVPLSYLFSWIRSAKIITGVGCYGRKHFLRRGGTPFSEGIPGHGVLRSSQGVEAITESILRRGWVAPFT